MKVLSLLVCFIAATQALPTKDTASVNTLVDTPVEEVPAPVEPVEPVKPAQLGLWDRFSLWLTDSKHSRETVGREARVVYRQKRLQTKRKDSVSFLHKLSKSYKLPESNYDESTIETINRLVESSHYLITVMDNIILTIEKLRLTKVHSLFYREEYKMQFKTVVSAYEQHYDTTSRSIKSIYAMLNAKKNSAEGIQAEKVNLDKELLSWAEPIDSLTVLMDDLYEDIPTTKLNGDKFFAKFILKIPNAQQRAERKLLLISSALTPSAFKTSMQGFATSLMEFWGVLDVSTETLHAKDIEYKPVDLVIPVKHLIESVNEADKVMNAKLENGYRSTMGLLSVKKQEKAILDGLTVSKEGLVKVMQNWNQAESDLQKYMQSLNME